MNEKRNAARILVGIVMVAGVVAGTVAPAQARDSGWNGTRVISKADSGWNGTR